MKLAISLIVLAIMLLGAACSPARAPEASEPPVQEAHAGPATSSADVTIELPAITYGERCLVLDVSVSGAHLPPEPQSTDGPLLPVVAAAIFHDGIELDLEAMAGGGGGGSGDDGSFQISQQTIYEVGSPLPPNTTLPLIVELTMDDSLGFESPLRFIVHAEPDPSSDCGL